MMVFYRARPAPTPHRCRFVLFEKGMDFEIRDVDPYNKPEDIAVMNPLRPALILVERDLILYESNIINEYIDERFPASAADAGRSWWIRRACACSCSTSRRNCSPMSTILEQRNVKGNEKRSRSRRRISATA